MYLTAKEGLNTLKIQSVVVININFEVILEFQNFIFLKQLFSNQREKEPCLYVFSLTAKNSQPTKTKLDYFMP